MKQIRVIVADDDPVAREVAAAYIDADEGLVLAGAAEDADEAAVLAEREQPDAALIDVEMPGGGGEAAVRQIAERSPGTAVVALSAHDDERSVMGMLQAGAVSYVRKGASADELCSAIARSVEAHELLD